MSRRLMVLTVVCLALTASTVTPTNAEETESHRVVGLVRVLKKKRAHWYSPPAPRLFEYKLENTSKTLIVPKKLKRIPDLRNFGEKHPVLQGFHNIADWGYPIGALALLGVSALRGGR